MEGSRYASSLANEASQPAASPLEKRSQEAYELLPPLPASNRRAQVETELIWLFGWPLDFWMLSWRAMDARALSQSIVAIAAWDPAIWFGQHSTCGG